MKRHSTSIPKRKTQRRRRGAAVSVYLDFDLLGGINAWAERHHMNFNDAVRDILYVAASTVNELRRDVDAARSPTAKRR